MAKTQLMCGDCLEIIKSQRFTDLTKGRNVVIVTDPPFNIGYHYNTFKDRMEEKEYFSWLEDVVSIGGGIVMIHYPESLYKFAIKWGEAPKKVVSWTYNSNTSKQHRDIAFFDIMPNFNQVRQPYKNPMDKRIAELIKKGRSGARLYDWWNVNQVKNVSKEKTAHPCQMPQIVMDNIIGILPRDKKMIVVDPFMGSGTTGVSCLKYGVDFIGIELDEEYYNIAKERIETYDLQRQLDNRRDETASRLLCFES